MRGLGVSYAANEGAVDGTVLNRFVRIFIALSLVILIGSVSLLFAVRYRNQAVDGENRLWRPGQIAAIEVLTAALDQQTGVRGFVITGDKTVPRAVHGRTATKHRSPRNASH